MPAFKKFRVTGMQAFDIICTYVHCLESRLEARMPEFAPDSFGPHILQANQAPDLASSMPKATLPGIEEAIHGAHAV